MRKNIEVLMQWLKRNKAGSKRINRMYESKIQEQRRLSKTIREQNRY